MGIKNLTNERNIINITEYMDSFENLNDCFKIQLKLVYLK